jgi:hypothetical protein
MMCLSRFCVSFGFQICIQHKSSRSISRKQYYNTESLIRPLRFPDDQSFLPGCRHQLSSQSSFFQDFGMVHTVLVSFHKVKRLVQPKKPRNERFSTYIIDGQIILYIPSRATFTSEKRNSVIMKISCLVFFGHFPASCLSPCFSLCTQP